MVLTAVEVCPSNISITSHRSIAKQLVSSSVQDSQDGLLQGATEPFLRVIESILSHPEYSMPENINICDSSFKSLQAGNCLGGWQSSVNELR